MKIAIVSDTHDNMGNFLKAINWLNKEGISVMLHCGDVCNKDTVEEAIKAFKGQITWVRGNGDHHLDDIPQKQELELGGNPSTGLRARKIHMNHYPEIAKKKAETGKYDMVFYGHTHRPWMEEIGKCKLVNPGELAGQRFKPCFAVYDTESDKLELKILETL